MSMCPEMSKHYNQKASLEQELPTVTQKLSTTSECLLGSLGSLTSSTGKVRTTGGRQQPGLYLLYRMCYLLSVMHKSFIVSSFQLQLDHVGNLPLMWWHRTAGLRWVAVKCSKILSKSQFVQLLPSQRKGINDFSLWIKRTVGWDVCTDGRHSPVGCSVE